ncbi:MAG: S8 family serine peptidase [Eubacterium sp.]|nr:S8 family serine peptidase [Eubacterium sp.]
MKKCIALIATLALMLNLSTVSSTAGTIDTGVADNDTPSELTIDESICLSGEALVTLTLANGEDSPLIHEGSLKNDPRIHINRVMHFGTMVVSHISSTACDTASLITLAEAYAHVTNVSPNCRLKKDSLTNDPLISDQWALGGERFYSPISPSASSPDTKTEVASPAAASVGFQKETATVSDKDTPVIAVIDDGIDFSHEDLQDCKWVNTYSSLKGKNGYDFVNDDTDPSPTDEEDFHATRIAGIIAASADNGVGIAGIAQHVKLMSLKVFDTGNPQESGTNAAVIAAMEYVYKASRLGVNIVAMNCSFAFDPSNQPYDEFTQILPTLNTILTKLGTEGVLYVASSGNESTEITKNTYGSPFELDPTYRLLVGSSDKDGNPSYFSNFGKDCVDLFAPGEFVLTTTLEPVFLPTTYSKEKQKKLCRFVDSFDKSDTGLHAYAEYSQREKEAVTFTHSYYDSYGNPQSGSARIQLKRSRTASPNAYKIFYDVTSYNLDINKEVYVSFLFKLDGDTWTPSSSALSMGGPLGLYAINGRTYLSIDLKKLASIDFSILLGKSVYIDDLSISVDNPDPRDFGCYTFTDGTSFSVPYVCGAIARLANLFPKDNALTRKKKLLTLVKPTESLKDYCLSGGTLNISGFADSGDIHVDAIKYPVTKIQLNRTKASLKPGKTLKLKATISPSYATNKAVRWTVNKKAFASVSAKGVVKAKKKGRGRTVIVTATAKDGSKKKATCKITIKAR